jgi:hypothetical protein
MGEADRIDVDEFIRKLRRRTRPEALVSAIAWVLSRPAAELPPELADWDDDDRLELVARALALAERMRDGP